MKQTEAVKPIHPGETLRTDYLEPLNISVSELAQKLQVEELVIQELLTEKAHLTIDLAYRLYCYFGISARYWLNLQRDYDLAIYPDKEILKKQIKPHFWEKAEIWKTSKKEEPLV